MEYSIPPRAASSRNGKARETGRFREVRLAAAALAG